ncbi:2-dehydropantoate 2-reductase [Streptomyces sp. P38-E01]|uniref:2-dehydropantoate 2-reductase n=1 Tax=Streptomyces tardus TaxID=2780544 RepID=A0A949N7R9_9ACTN|nr:2-dehydropantoate 2-reductase [Streptomyces tardus]MBU7597726.1 2-dehydropantoate 2-reductase [Streptomyces tardus]
MSVPEQTGYTVVGGGAIGGTLAHSLIAAGHPVTLVDTDAEHVAQVRAHGLTVLRGQERETVAPRAVTTPEQYAGPPLGRVLLAVKAQATEAAMDWIAPRLAEDGCVVSVQNGFNEDLIASYVGVGRTVAAFVNIFADLAEPGVIRYGGPGALVLGEVGGAPVSPRVRSIVADLRAWGPALASDNVEGYLWAKAGFGAMLSATALADAPMADLIDRHRPAMYALVREIFAVADASGVRRESFDAFDAVAMGPQSSPAVREAACDELVRWLRGQPKDRSGIWRDLAVRRRPVEVTTHYGSVLAGAEQAGLEAPVLRAVLEGLRALERDPAGMSEQLLDELDRLAADLAAYTSVESASDDLDALRTCLEHLRGWLDRSLGAPAQEERRERPGAADVLIRRYAGTGALRDAPPVLLLAHYDTVWPTGTLEQWPFGRDGDRIVGPGVFDMKAGLVQVVWALRALHALGLPAPPCTLLLNGDEETGSAASQAVIEAEARAARAVLVFEASADGGALKTTRKGVGLFTLTVEGVEAHAGLDPADGASAVLEAAHRIIALDRLQDLSLGTSVNVGVVAGGTRSNVTAGHFRAELDIRVATGEERDRISRALAEIAPLDARTTVRLTGGWNRPVFERTPGVARLYELARACARPLGVDLRETAVGGASDGNFALATGTPVLDGLGAIGGGAHARSEHVSAAGMVERSALAAGVLAAFAADRPAEAA